MFFPLKHSFIFMYNLFSLILFFNCLFVFMFFIFICLACHVNVNHQLSSFAVYVTIPLCYVTMSFSCCSFESVCVCVGVNLSVYLNFSVIYWTFLFNTKEYYSPHTSFYGFEKALLATVCTLILQRVCWGKKLRPAPPSLFLLHKLQTLHGDDVLALVFLHLPADSLMSLCQNGSHASIFGIDIVKCMFLLVQSLVQLQTENVSAVIDFWICIKRLSSCRAKTVKGKLQKATELITVSWPDFALWTKKNAVFKLSVWQQVF